jgi:hypothetical protein
MANVVCTSHDSTGAPTPVDLGVELGLFVAVLFLFFFPGVLIQGTGGGGIGTAMPMALELRLLAELSRLRGVGCCSCWGDGLGSGQPFRRRGLRVVPETGLLKVLTPLGVGLLWTPCSAGT